MAEMEQVGEDLDVGTYVSLVIRCIGNEVALKALEAEVFEAFDSVLVSCRAHIHPRDLGHAHRALVAEFGHHSGLARRHVRVGHEAYAVARVDVMPRFAGLGLHVAAHFDGSPDRRAYPYRGVDFVAAAQHVAGGRPLEHVAEVDLDSPPQHVRSVAGVVAAQVPGVGNHDLSHARCGR